VTDLGLSSISYDETGSDTYSVSQTGTGSITGSGYVNLGGPEGNGVTAGTWARTDTFGYQENGTFSYSESGGYSYTAHDRGQSQGGAVALSSVLFNEDNGNAGSWAFAASGTMTFGDTQTLDGGASGTATNGEGFGYGSFSSSTGLSSSDDRSAVYVGGGTFGASDTGSGSFTLHQAGSYANGGTTTFGSDPGDLGRDGWWW
jgi:hypothetical protein